MPVDEAGFDVIAAGGFPSVNALHTSLPFGVVMADASVLHSDAAAFFDAAFRSKSAAALAA